MRTLFKEESLKESLKYLKFLADMLEKERCTDEFFFYMEAMTLHLRYLEVRGSLEQSPNEDLSNHKITKTQK